MLVEKWWARRLCAFAHPTASRLGLKSRHLAADLGGVFRIDFADDPVAAGALGLEQLHVGPGDQLGRADRLAALDATGDSEPGSTVELRRYEDTRGRQRLAVAVRSDLRLEGQVKANGATWLDRQLLTREPISLSEGGFGREVRDAMDARVDHLASEGLARRQGQRVIFVRDLLETLRRRELDAAGAKFSAETGLPYRSFAEGESVAGVYRQRVSLASGRFAMIDDGLGFSLVPWTPSLERQLGKQVSGVVRSVNSIEWSFGRKQGLGL